MTDEGPACDTCRYWVIANEWRGEAYGECRRYAPRSQVELHPVADALSMASDEHDLYTLFPQTFAWQWCGEWQTRRPTGNSGH